MTEQTSQPSPDTPVTFVKGDLSRQVSSAAEEVRLRFDGWRRADEPPVQRGQFLPPPTRLDLGGSAAATVANNTDHPEPVITPGDNPGDPAVENGGPDQPSPKSGRKSTK